MDSFYLSNEEDATLRFSIMLPSKRSLYEYLCELPLEKLKVYPKKGYHWWMGRAARSDQAIMLRNYILHWRLAALSFQKTYPREYLETLSPDDLRAFLRTHIQKTPAWAYETSLRDATHILSHREEPRT